MKRANTKILGMFVVGGLALLVIGIVVFGSGRFFQKTYPQVAYFEESLAGLSEGAPVNFRGVRIGTVTRIVFEYDRSALAFATPVHFEIDPSRFVETGEQDSSREPREQGTTALIAKGLRAQLGIASLVTGQKVLNLVMRPDTETALVGDEPLGVEVPTIPSDTAEIKNTVAEVMARLTDVLDRLANMDIDKINNDMETLLAGLTQLVDNPEIAEVIHQANLAVPAVRQLINTIERDIESLAGGFGTAAERATGTLEKAQDTLQKADGAIAEVGNTFAGARGALRQGNEFLEAANGLIEPGSQPYHELVTMLREITATARSVRNLANTLERDPESLLFGRQRSRR